MQWHWAARTWEMGRDGIECTMVWFWYDYESGGWLVRVRSRKALGALYTVCDVCACPCVDRRIWILEMKAGAQSPKRNEVCEPFILHGKH